MCVKMCLQLKTPTRTYECTMQMSYLYSSHLPFKHFCKLTKQTEKIRNYQEKVSVMTEHCLGISQINYQSKKFSDKTFYTEQMKLTHSTEKTHLFH